MCIIKAKFNLITNYNQTISILTILMNSEFS